MRISSKSASCVGLVVATLGVSSLSASAFIPNTVRPGSTGFRRPLGLVGSHVLRLPMAQLYKNSSPETGKTEDTSNSKRRKRDKISSLSALAIDSSQSGSFGLSNEDDSFWSSIQPVLSAALLITGNTVGASCLVLPDMAARPGMAISSLLFVGAYVMNLISGIVLAEVAIKQHESSGSDVPSSFKEFADENLDLPMAGTLISVASLFVNSCVMSFDLVRAGEITSNLTGGTDSMLMSLGVAIGLCGLVSTQSSKSLSNIASIAVTALFVAFAGLLLPGLANVQDPVEVFLTPGTSSDIMSGVSQAAPIILMTMVYQNIVPSVTKMLDYDRTKTVAAISLGSLIPCFMFLAWCFAAIGGGVDASVTGGGPLMTAFSLAAVSGSTIGASMSLSEELETFVSEKKPSSDDMETAVEDTDRVGSLPTVITAVAIPLTAGYLFSGGEDFTLALQVAGGYGSPLLYGVIPAAMAWTQRNRLKAKENLLPGGYASIGGLGAAAAGFVGQEFFQDVGHAMISGVY